MGVSGSLLSLLAAAALLLAIVRVQRLATSGGALVRNADPPPLRGGRGACATACRPTGVMQ